MPSCVLAYSGGLDTSAILGWLKDEGYDVHAVYVDLGQPCENRDAVMQKARQCGAKSARIVDAQEELCRDFAFPVLMWGAKYESIYLMGTSIARPLISKVCLQVAREVGADAYAHGATGKGNDQCRFQLAAVALEPQIKIIAPWRIERFRAQFPGRKEMLAYCDTKGIPVKATASKPYSSDENCLHISYEAGKLEDPTVDGQTIIDFGMTVSPQQAPDKEERVTIGFESGVPASVNGKKLSAFGIVKTLNEMYRSRLGRARMGLDYALLRRGPLTMAPSQLGLFTRSDRYRERANIQFHVQPLSLDRFGEPLHEFPAFTSSVCNVQPTSRGCVRLRSPEPGDKPAILRPVERLEAGGQDADANGFRRLLAEGGTCTENQYGESSEKDDTRGFLASTHSTPPVHSITGSARTSNDNGIVKPNSKWSPRCQPMR